MRPDLAPHEQLLLLGAFTADDMSDLLRPAEADPNVRTLRAEAETDYALARFVAANCAAAGDFLDVPTPFVLKGGLAVYACFRGRRRSRDADVSPSSLDVEVEGLEPPDLLSVPDGMRLLDPTQVTEEGWKLPVEFTTTTGDDVAQIICDLNKQSRAIRQRPAIKRPFESKFTTRPVPIWVSRAEEIIAEKIGALLRRRNGRLRDIHDIGHLLGIASDLDLDTAMIRAATKDALQDLLPLVNLRQSVRDLIVARANERDDLEWVLGEISLIGYNARADSWAEQVGNIVPDAGTPKEETDRLAGLWRDLRLLER